MSAGSTTLFRQSFLGTVFFKKMCPVMFLAEFTTNCLFTTNRTIYFCFRMMGHMFKLIIDQFKIFYSVIISNTINVMYHLIRKQMSAKIFFHNQNMFKDVTITSRSVMQWITNHSITFFRFDVNSTLPIIVFSTFGKVVKITRTTKTSIRTTFQMRWSIINDFLTTLVTGFNILHKYNISNYGKLVNTLEVI